MEQMEQNLNWLCALPGVSSREEAVRDAVRTVAEAYADEVREDALGNLLVLKRGHAPHPRVMLTAHLDEVGVMVTGYTEDGFLRFDLVGDVDRRTLVGKRVYLGQERLPGVFGMKPIHLSTREERKKYPPVEQLYLDVGLSSRAKAEKKFPLGTVGCFSSGVGAFGATRVKGTALSGRTGCALLLELLKGGLPSDTWFVFTVMEEVGCRGAFGAAFRLEPEIALVLDGAPANDLPGVDEAKRGCALGKGVVLRRMDRGTIYDKALFQLLRRTAEREEIPWQLLREPCVETEGSAVQRSRSGVRVAALSLPVRYAKSPTEVADRRDMDGLCRLTEAFLEAVQEENHE